jgi:hypothetical protein
MPMTQTEDRHEAEGKPPPCPACGSRRVLPIVHGIPSRAEREALDKGEAIMADREEWEGLTQWYCKQCGCDWSGAWRRFKKAPG